MMKPIFALALSVCAMACTQSVALVGSSCGSTTDCTAGLVCTESKCSSPCAGGVQCSTASESLAAAPTIAAVAGASAAGTVGMGLRVTGSNLANVQLLRLLDQASTVVGNLVISTAEASEVTAAIPDELARAIAASPTGQFILEAQNAGGAARQNVTILKGDAGAQGPQGPAGASGLVSLPFLGTAASTEPVFKVSNSGVGATIVAANTAPANSGVALKVEGNTDLKFHTSGVRLPLFVMSRGGYFSFCTSDGAPFNGTTNVKTGLPISCGCSCINGTENGAVSMMLANGTNPGDGYTEIDFGGGCYCNSGGACPVQKTYATCLRSF